MSYEKVKAISLKDNQVYLTSATSNVRPLYFTRWECKPLSQIYAQEGRAAVLSALGKDIWNGELQLYKGSSRLCELFLAARDAMPGDLHFSNYDGKTAGEFLARMVMKLEQDPHADLSSDVNEMLAKRNDRDYILEAAQRTGHNFIDFAGEDLQKDRQFNLQVLEAGAGRPWFDYPRHFSDDRAFALTALPYNGCFFRSLSPALRADKEVICLAYQEDGRTYHEHLPDLLPASILTDQEFMKHLIEICPSLHLSRTPALLLNRELSLTFAKHGKFLPHQLDLIPTEFLQSDEFKDVLMGRFGEGEAYTKLSEKYIALGLVPPSRHHQSLADQIQKAESQRTQDIIHNASEKDRHQDPER